MTNDELLSHKKIGPELAARYLQNGTTAQEIRVMAQNGLCPFCDAIKGKGRYSYRVNIGLLMRFKAGDLGLYAQQKN